jgi:hypothetical protein
MAKPCDVSMKNLQKPKSSHSVRSKIRSPAAPLALLLTHKKSPHTLTWWWVGIVNILGR